MLDTGNYRFEPIFDDRRSSYTRVEAGILLSGGGTIN